MNKDLIFIHKLVLCGGYCVREKIMDEEQQEKESLDIGDFNCPYCGIYFNRFWPDGKNKIDSHLVYCKQSNEFKE